ncbi:MAG TPA: DUF1641 domain-containing protein [Acidisarcina sp.]
MAKAIEFRPVLPAAGQSTGIRENTMQRLGEAPVAHADAVLAAYDLLEQMHKSGTLDLLRGGLSAGGKIVEEVSALLVQPETIRGVRNLILLSKMMAGISPEAVERISRVLPQMDVQQTHTRPPSMFSLLRRMFSADVRRGLALGLTAAEALGKSTQPQPK